MNLSDTITAIATPPGESGIGIIRISGPRSKEIALKLVRTANSKPFVYIEDHRVYYGKLVDPCTNDSIDEILFFYAANPRSFTTEDTVEIHSHGGMFILKKILELLTSNGARIAEAGEFTQRAFLNGRIDLIQAESVIDLIRAKTEKAHQMAINQLVGGPSQFLRQIETELYQILIQIEAILDFPEEGIPEPNQAEIQRKSSQIRDQLAEIYRNIDEGRKIRDGIIVVITGRPNVGKSSLLNAFLNEERAIVTATPGTTRDIIEAQIQLQGIPIRLIDTAGLRKAENEIEQIGISKAEQFLEIADLIIFLLDNNQPLTDEDRSIARKIADKRFIIVINKIDLPRHLEIERVNELHPLAVIETSILTKSGFKEIEKEIIDMVGLGHIKYEDLPMLTNVRHKIALEKSILAIDNFREGLDKAISEDLLAVDLRTCLVAMGEITGKNVSEEVLQGIFAQFCIGK